MQTIRNRKTRSLSMGEREEIAEIASTKLKIDLDIQFDYNSADISASSLPAVQSLGQALSNANLKGSTFIVAGHTDAIGGEAFNQGLSERRADSIKKYLVDKFGIAGSDLVTVGYGKDKAEGSERADGPDQPSRSGRQHGYQDRIAMTVTRYRLPSPGRRTLRMKPGPADRQADGTSDRAPDFQISNLTGDSHEEACHRGCRLFAITASATRRDL